MTERTEGDGAMENYQLLVYGRLRVVKDLTGGRQVEGIMQTRHNRMHPMALTHKFGIFYCAPLTRFVSFGEGLFWEFSTDARRLHLFEAHTKSVTVDPRPTVWRRLLNRPAHDSGVGKVVIRVK